MSELISTALAAHHARDAFRCGVPELDKYLREQAMQDVRRHVAATYVLVESTRPTAVVGYYTLSSYAVETAELPEEMRRKLPRYPLTPATLIGRLARDIHFPGMGSHLLADALRRILAHSRTIASAVVIVDVKDEMAGRFYLRHGFLGFPGVPNRLFLPMKAVAAITK